MEHFFSPKQIAAAMGVSESSLKRWVDKGFIHAHKTGGGHRRMQLESVLNYARVTGKNFLRPDLIGLPIGLGSTSDSVEHAHQEFASALRSKDAVTSRRVVLDLYLNGMSIAEIFDRIVSPGIESIGELWRQRRIPVGLERHANDVCWKIVTEFGGAIKQGSSVGPIAISGTLNGEHWLTSISNRPPGQNHTRPESSQHEPQRCVLAIDYAALADSMTQIVLRDSGWRVDSVGKMTSFDKLLRAMEIDRPQLTWICVPSILDFDRFKASFNVLFDTATSLGCALILGGQALTPDVRRLLNVTMYCDSFRSLESVSKTLHQKVATV